MLSISGSGTTSKIETMHFSGPGAFRQCVTAVLKFK